VRPQADNDRSQMDEIGSSPSHPLLAKLKQLVQILLVSQSEIQSALSSQFNDFEDAIQHFTAKAERASALSSRATKPIFLYRNSSPNAAGISRVARKGRVIKM
jgi:hypothetical protein